MPLVRVQVRNEYGLGLPELYGESSREDPKAVLDGVAVAGLVGILRQLGDLAEFAAEVFHGLQEQVMTTASRSHKVMVRLQKIEAALPQIEKAALAQTSHIHFAYTAGSDWHARIRNEQNHFICNDLPHFIMDNYEECREPPRLYLLDKFDTGGPGSCLKRYSDPTFFKRVSASNDEAKAEKFQRDKKARKSKKRRSRQRNGEVLRGVSLSNRSGRMQFASPNVNGKTSPQTASTFDVTLKSDLGTKSNSFDSKSGPGYKDCVLQMSSTMQSEEEESVELSSSRLKIQHCDSPMQPEEEEPMELPSSSIKMQDRDFPESTFLGGGNRVVGEDFIGTSMQVQIAPCSSFVTWDEKTEIIEPKGQLDDSGNSGDMLRTDYYLEAQERRLIGNAHVVDLLYDDEYIKMEIVESKVQQHGADKSPEMLPTVSDLDTKEIESVSTVNRVQIPTDSEYIPKQIFGGDQLEEIESETDNYMDALNTIDSESESDFDCQMKTEVKQFLPISSDGLTDGAVHMSTVHPSDHYTSDSDYQIASCSSPNQVLSWHLPKSVSTVHKHLPDIVGTPSDPDSSPVIICDNPGNPDHSIGETISSYPSSSSSTACCSLPPSGEKILSSSPAVVIGENNLGNPDHLKFETTSSYPSSSSSTAFCSLLPTGEKILSSSPAVVIGENNPGNPYRLKFETIRSHPSSSSTTTCSSLPPGGEKILSSSPVDICENASNSDNSNFESVCSNPSASSFTVCSSQAPSGDMFTTYSPVADICETAEIPNYSNFESVGGDSSSSKSTVCTFEPPSGDKTINGVCESREHVEKFPAVQSDFEPAGGDPSSSKSTLCTFEPPSGDKIINGVWESREHVEKFPAVHSDFEPVGGDPSSSKSTVCTFEPPSGDKIINDVWESREHVEKFPAVQSIKLWTNGGLLGLEPSKPPDFSAMNAASEESVGKIKNATVSPNNHNGMLMGDRCRQEMDILLEKSQNIEKDSSSKCPMLCHDNQADDMCTQDSSLEIRSAGFDAKNHESSDYHHSNVVKHIHGCISEFSEVIPEAELLDAPDAKTTSTARENDEHLFNMFGLSNRIIANGFRRKVSLVLDDKSEPASGHHSVVYQTSSRTILNDKLEDGSHGSLLDSPSSPPLEHMNISFPPINAFDNTKLKLKFPDRSDCHESIGDIFPSFQLVPEPTILPHEIGSDSDDDTFCRSSPDMSDDFRSHHSESDSEQWESGKTLGSKDHELYNGFNRISSMEFIPSSLGLEGITHGSAQVDSGRIPCTENGVELSHYGQLLELPSFDTLDSPLQQEADNVSIPRDLFKLQHSIESAPLPPPLPPLRWQAMKSHSDVAEGKQDDASDMVIMESRISEQPGPAPARNHIPEEAIVFTEKGKLPSQQKLNGQKEETENSNGKGMDERKDFLQQIRSQSFNLRHAATPRPTFATGPTTNVKVTAILEKAIAIRQAVGSDDGEDEDNWSDM